MRCEEITALIERFLEGEASAADLGAAEAHAEGCTACATALAEARALAGALEAALRAPVPAGGAERVLEVVRNEDEFSRRGHRDHRDVNPGPSVTSVISVASFPPRAARRGFLRPLAALAAGILVLASLAHGVRTAHDSSERLAKREELRKLASVAHLQAAITATALPQGDDDPPPEFYDETIYLVTDRTHSIEYTVVDSSEISWLTAGLGKISGEMGPMRGKGLVGRRLIQSGKEVDKALKRLSTRGEGEDTARRDAGAPAGLVARDAQGNPTEAFPLERTDVRAEISGALASTLVTQRFANPYDRKIEAIYTFPLPAASAVSEFVMEIGERRIRGIVRERAEARRLYEEARARGEVASLLEQERPNVFTQSVANIEPGKAVDVRIRFFHALPCDRATYEYVFPLVVGHRYGGDPAVQPPRLAEGARSGHAVSIEVVLDAGLPLDEVLSPSHNVLVEPRGPNAAHVTLVETDKAADRDFILRFKVGAEHETALGFLAHVGERGRFFQLLVAPPLAPEDADIVPRELFFILDSSGSMSGIPIEQSKRFMRRALKDLRPNDVFNVATFAGDARLMSETFLAPTTENVAAATQWVEDLQGAGGTEAEKGIRLALEHPRDRARMRMVIFLTDGGVSFEGDIFARIKQAGGGARVFSFGVGSAPNRWLLDRMAEVGNGAAAYIPQNAPEAEIADEVEAFYARIDAPVLTDVEIDWVHYRGHVEDVYPAKLPDLFTGQPLLVHGRFREEATWTGGPRRGPVILRGRCGGRLVERRFELTFPAEEPKNAVLAPVWARSKVSDLMGRMDGLEPARAEPLAAEIKALGLDFQIATPYTSFVAIDSESKTGPEAPVKVDQPVEVPAGVNPGNFEGKR